MMDTPKVGDIWHYTRIAKHPVWKNDATFLLLEVPTAYGSEVNGAVGTWFFTGLKLETGEKVYALRMDIGNGMAERFRDKWTKVA